MNIGISYWFGYPAYPEERIYLLNKYGFKHVSLHWTDEYEQVTGKKEDISLLLNKSNIMISSFHLSFEKSHYIWNDDMCGKIYRKDLINAVDAACFYNVPIVVIHSNGNIKSVEEIKYLENVIEYAKRKNVYLCLENLQFEDNLHTIGAYLENIYYCYDIGHANIRKCPFSINDKIKYLHIHDNNGIDDSHMLPFEGKIDWDKVISDLLNIKVEHGILEVHKNMNNREEAEEYLAQVAMNVKKIENMLNVRNV